MSERASLYLAEFAKKRNEISKGIEKKEEWKSLLQHLTSLRKDFAEATELLPAYDLRQCELQLKELDNGVDTLRASAPKAKFAFKRKAADPSSSSVPPPAISTPLAGGVATGPEASDSAPFARKTTLDTDDTANPPNPNPIMVLGNESAPNSTSQLSISNRSNCLLTLSSLDSSPIAESLPSHSSLSISSVQSCVVDLRHETSSSLSQPRNVKINALHISGLRKVVLACGFIDGSVMIHDCEDCLIVLGCRQFRIHTSSGVKVKLYVSSLPVIEHCKDIEFGPFEVLLASSGFPEAQSKHFEVQDFDWIRDTPSPHWRKSQDDEKASLKLKRALDDVQEVGVEGCLGHILP